MSLFFQVSFPFNDPDKEDQDKEDRGCYHKVSEYFIRLPEVFIMSVKRYTRGRKILKAVNPAPIILLNEYGQEQVNYLKSIVRHHGTSIGGGHYTTSLNMDGKWLICNDDEDFRLTEEAPLDGYIYLHEKAHLNISQAVSYTHLTLPTNREV